MIIDFVYYMMELENAEDGDTTALHDSYQCREAQHGDPEEVMDDQDQLQPVRQDSGHCPAITHAHVQEQPDAPVQQHNKKAQTVHDRVAAIKSIRQLSAMTYIKSIKDMVREFCIDNPEERTRR